MWRNFVHDQKAIGPPKATQQYTKQELETMNVVGIYLTENSRSFNKDFNQEIAKSYEGQNLVCQTIKTVCQGTLSPIDQHTTRIGDSIVLNEEIILLKDTQQPTSLGVC